MRTAVGVTAATVVIAILMRLVGWLMGYAISMAKTVAVFAVFALLAWLLYKAITPSTAAREQASGGGDDNNNATASEG